MAGHYEKDRRHKDKLIELADKYLNPGGDMTLQELEEQLELHGYVS